MKFASPGVCMKDSLYPLRKEIQAKAIKPPPFRTNTPKSRASSLWTQPGSALSRGKWSVAHPRPQALFPTPKSLGTRMSVAQPCSGTVWKDWVRINCGKVFWDLWGILRPFFLNTKCLSD